MFLHFRVTNQTLCSCCLMVLSTSSRRCTSYAKTGEMEMEMEMGMSNTFPKYTQKSIVKSPLHHNNFSASSLIFGTRLLCSASTFAKVAIVLMAFNICSRPLRWPTGMNTWDGCARRVVKPFHMQTLTK